MSEDLPRVFDDNLIRLKGAVTAHSISTIWRFDNFDADIVFSPSFGTLLQLLEASVTAFPSQSAITVVAFVKHVAILAVLIASILLCAQAF